MTTSPLGDPDLTTDVAIREYCEKARKAFRQLHAELEIAADELQAYLAEVPNPPADSGYRSSSHRARIVAGHMRTAADASGRAAVAFVRVWRSLERQFAPELNAARGKPAKAKKPSFKFEGA